MLGWIFRSKDVIKNDDSHAPSAIAAAAFRSAAWGVVLVGGPFGGTRFGMGGGLRSRCGPLSPSRPSHTCVQVLMPRDPVGSSAAGRPRRKLSHPSCIRVERATTRGAASRGARCPTTTGAAPEHCIRSARQAREGRSFGSRSSVAGLVTARSAGPRP